ncbi:hypothetical protein NQ176_g7274 [Zarea fungicola]|uniref:Uncharacterized protein n=1 Tax=Zarea fungicola TaxID=93591 RepID=A0ACC1MYZ7_9HYPO|nr:hypothetical protein NQ176_g7274 [Lecanicillium fungicola]
MFPAQLAVLLAAPVVYSACTNDNRACSWTGTAPFCGGESVSIGTKRGHEELVAKSETYSASTLLSDGKISTDCYNDYGASCFTGFKALWCALPRDAGAYTYTYTTNKDGGYKVIITLDNGKACTTDVKGDDISAIVKAEASKCT